MRRFCAACLPLPCLQRALPVFLVHMVLAGGSTARLVPIQLRLSCVAFHQGRPTLRPLGHLWLSFCSGGRWHGNGTCWTLRQLCRMSGNMSGTVLRRLEQFGVHYVRLARAARVLAGNTSVCLFCFMWLANVRGELYIQFVVHFMLALYHGGSHLCHLVHKPAYPTMADDIHASTSTKQGVILVHKPIWQAP